MNRGAGGGLSDLQDSPSWHGSQLASDCGGKYAIHPSGAGEGTFHSAVCLPVTPISFQIYLLLILIQNLGYLSVSLFCVLFYLIFLSL